MRPVAVLALAILAACAGCLDDGGDPDDAGPETPAAVPGQAGILTGRLTAAAPGLVHDLALAEGHDGVRFALLLVTNIPDTEIALNVTAPDGRSDEMETGPLLYAFPGFVPGTTFDAPTGGDWTLAVALTGGAAADYEVHWCTEGHSDAANRACERYG